VEKIHDQKQITLTEVSLCLEELIMVMLTVKMMLVRYIVRWTDHTTTMCASKTAFMRKFRYFNTQSMTRLSRAIDDDDMQGNLSYLSSKNTKVKHHDPNLKAKPNPDRKNHDRAQSKIGNLKPNPTHESSPDWKNNQAYPPLLFISFLPSTNSQFLLELKLQPNLQAEQGLGAMICFIDIYGDFNTIQCKPLMMAISLFKGYLNFFSGLGFPPNLEF
ncbi:hypothetical protein G4B88_030619, partial [Cannabis sativa]